MQNPVFCVSYFKNDTSNRKSLRESFQKVVPSPTGCQPVFELFSMLYTTYCFFSSEKILFFHSQGIHTEESVSTIVTMHQYTARPQTILHQRKGIFTYYRTGVGVHVYKRRLTQERINWMQIYYDIIVVCSQNILLCVTCVLAIYVPVACSTKSI